MKKNEEILNIPENIKITIYENENKNYLKIEGKLGCLEVLIPNLLKLLKDKNFLKIEIISNQKNTKSYENTVIKVFTTYLKNSFRGLSTGFYSDLLIRGTGYKAIIDKDAQSIELKIGTTHPVIKKIPSDINVFYHVKLKKLYISSNDKQKVTQFSSELRDLKRPDPYKAKGLRRAGEIIKLKEGKKSRK